MPKIHTYEFDTPPSIDDKVLGSDSNGNATKNYRLGDVLGLVADAGFYEPIDVTYTQLKSLVDAGTLVRGAIYRFAHTTEHLIVGTSAGTEKASDYMVNPAENFLVRALDEGTLDTRVVSELHPQDIIEWTPYVDGWGGLEHANSMGQITYRRMGVDNSIQGWEIFIDGQFDVRYCVYLSWGYDSTQIQSAVNPYISDTDEPVLWQEGTFNNFGIKEDGSFYSLSTTGTVTASRVVPWETADAIAGYPPNADATIRFGEYYQNVVFHVDGQGSDIFCFGDFRKAHKVRSTTNMISERSDSVATFEGIKTQPEIRECIFTCGNGDGTNGATRIACDTAFRVFTKANNVWLGGHHFRNCVLLGRDTVSFWYTYLTLEAVGSVDRCIFDAVQDNGNFYPSASDRQFDKYQNCQNALFKGYSSQAGSKGRVVRDIQNGDEEALAVVEKITHNAVANNRGGDHNDFESGNSSVTTAELTIPIEDSYCGIIPLATTIDTITRVGVSQRHPIRLKVTATITIDAGGNILNATGATYNNGDYVYLTEVVAGTWMILA